MSEPTCPLCKAPLKATAAERAVKPLGQKGRSITIEVGQREIFHCGAVRLTNRDYPDGVVEAKCCTAGEDRAKSKSKDKGTPASTDIDQP
ncbi:MAG: hypothetical protein JSS86_08045 [Cyanobacteria bacterium SZAS LIN-2]|nr:hypothetical protein [Cyanobacteria bacterium SZAS LIN-2]